MTNTQKALADRLFPKIEPTEDVELKNVPPEQRRLHTETADLTVSSLHGYMATGKIEIPEFQRSYVWNRTQASRLIESLIIQCPIPVIYFSQSTDNKLVVIDGNQRLLSIKLFMNDGYELQGLSTYPELNGTSWSGLDPRFRDHINNRTIRCITILKDTHPQIKFDVFERLNTGSVKLNAQELRHGINHGPLMRAIDNAAQIDTWKRLSGIKRDARMRGAELILRFFAFRHDRASYEKPLSGFLDAFSAKHRFLADNEAQAWTREFERTLDTVEHYLGRLAFRIFDEHLRPNSSLNAALFDAQMIGFSECQSPAIRNREIDPEEIQRRTLILFSDIEFENSIRQATSDEVAVRTRIDTYTDFLSRF